MEREIESTSRSRSPRKSQIVALVAALFAVSVWLVFVSWRESKLTTDRRKDPVSPYLNTRLEVKYLGDAACVGCHAKSALAFSQHPMGRSLAPISAAPVTKGDEGSGRPLFESQGLQYSIEDRDGRVFHQEARRDAHGKTVAKTEAEVQYVLGSGRQGHAYLIEHDGLLFESPITWYSRQNRWDLSPGFESHNYHFDRPISENCLFCHANRVEPRAGSINAYRPPIFRGHAIGCERCHGPGELHVGRPRFVDGKDMTIVNPADLAPALRDDVCAQCHLAGDHRVVRVDRRNEDFRPGLPFPRFWTVFVQPPEQGEDRFVGQFEQMHESACYRGSRGQLGCISCHDPHRFPAPAEKVAYYRDRCLECHADRGCSLSVSARVERVENNDCAGCHMPRARTLDIPHAASANHRIPRDAGGNDRLMANSSRTAREGRQLLVFYRQRIGAAERAEIERDRGVAVCGEGPRGRGSPSRCSRPLWLRGPMIRKPGNAKAMHWPAWAGMPTHWQLSRAP